MSKNTKQLLIILGIAAVFCIVAVAIAIGGMGLLANRLKDNVTTDKAKVRQMTSEFVKYKLPPRYAEQMGMDFLVYKMIFISTSDIDTSDGGTSRMAVVDPIILLAHFQAGDLTPEEMTKQMQQSMEQQSGSNGLKFKVVETRKVTINGKEAPLTISEGTNKAGTVLRQWVTVFPGKTGLILVLIQGDVDGWDDSAFESFLTSITT
jgi:hypothetical protein